MKIWYIEAMNRECKYTTILKGYSTFEKAKEAFYTLEDVEFHNRVLVAENEYYMYSVKAMEVE